MAFVLPFSAYAVYRLVAGASELKSPRRWLGAALGGYVGMNAAALAVGVELGLQPLLFHTANGTALYCPFPLGVAVPAMLIGHLTLAGPLEGVVTALVVRYLQATSPELLSLPAAAPVARPAAPADYRRLWWGLGALVILSPLGLLAQGTAWGEWAADEMKGLAGYVPAGLARLSETWTHAPLPDYALPSGGGGFWSSSLVYILSAVIGVAIIGAADVRAGPGADRRGEGACLMAEPAKALPRWLEGNPPIEGLRRVGRARRRGFLQKTLSNFAQTLQDQVFSERLARASGLLQRVDARLKLVTTLLLIGTAALLRHASLLVLLNAWVLYLAACSRVPLGPFLKRVWIVVPLFTLAVVLPATLNVVRPGTPLLVLFRLARPVHVWLWTMPQEVAVTRQGAASALLLVLRVGASVSLAVLLTLTTRWAALLRALRVLRVPAVFVSVLEMTYRYVFLLMQTAAEMFTARRSRTVGRTGAAEQRRFATGAMGGLWARTHATSEEVHRAMLSRGYTGEPRTLSPMRLEGGDALWALIVLLVVALLMGGDLALG